MQVYHGSKNIFLAFIRAVISKPYMHSDMLALAVLVPRTHTQQQFRNTRQTYSAASVTLRVILSRA